MTVFMTYLAGYLLPNPAWLHEIIHAIHALPDSVQLNHARVALITLSVELPA
jgi:hypothetical protein